MAESPSTSFTKPKSAPTQLTKEFVRVRPVNLKRRDRTKADPGIYYHYVGQDSNGQNRYAPGLVVNSDEEAERIQEIRKKQDETVPDVSKPVEEIRFRLVSSYSLKYTRPLHQNLPAKPGAVSILTIIIFDPT